MSEKVPKEVVKSGPAPSPSSLSGLALPTPRTDLFDAAITNAFISTNPEIPETALYGSARTGSDGRSRFHKGIDIAPVLPRTRKGEATDPVSAIADGTVLYVNRYAGNSSYGIYVVLLHADPVGEVYSLYAHLASVPKELRAGSSVKRGDAIGVLGRTSSVAKLPPWKSHLHFEAGLMLNSRFADWERETKQKPLRGNGHGWNLLPANPLEFLRSATESPDDFSMLAFLQSLHPACTIALHVERLPDYFQLHKPLWHGADVLPSGADIVLELTDSGLVISGRLATEAESKTLAALPRKAAQVAVLQTDPDLLGRNGMRLVVQDRGTWRFGSSESAHRWLEILCR